MSTIVHPVTTAPTTNTVIRMLVRAGMGGVAVTAIDPTHIGMMAAGKLELGSTEVVTLPYHCFKWRGWL